MHELVYVRDAFGAPQRKVFVYCRRCLHLVPAPERLRVAERTIGVLRRLAEGAGLTEEMLGFSWAAVQAELEAQHGKK